MGIVSADEEYKSLLRWIMTHGIEMETRNHKTKSICDAPNLLFYQTPLITVRKTAWRKAIREMEWFMSGDTKCPDELLDWWEGQLDGKMYRGGYSNQFRHSGRMDYSNKNFDQVQYLLDGLRNNPNSRRLVLTTWNPWEMAHITELNHNPNCPTCCHSTIIQLFVRHDTLFMTSYQRSCDVLLGLPHNLIQSWALLLYFAHHAKLNVGTLRWLLGDAHLYLEPSHQQAAQEIVSRSVFTQVDNPVRLVYKPNEGNGGQVPEFKAEDFEMEGEIPEPMCRIRPTLL